MDEETRRVQKKTEDTILNQVKFRAAYTEVPFLKRKRQCSGAQKKILNSNDEVSQVILVVKNPSANTADIRDTHLVPGSERSPE